MSSQRCAKPWARYDRFFPHRARHRAVRDALRCFKPCRQTRRARSCGDRGARRHSGRRIPRYRAGLWRCGTPDRPDLPAGHTLRVVTKTPAVPDACIDGRHKPQWLDSLARSLDRLKVSAVYGLLVHQASDLDKPGWQHLVDALQEAQARGLVSRIGVSIYDERQLMLAESRFRPELVQLPLNALDRRLILSGALARLKERGVEVHARSIFLQGLLLAPLSDLPDFFKPLHQQLAKMRSGWARRGLSPLAGCLAFVLHQIEVDAAIVGVNSVAEFEEITAAIADIGDAQVDQDVMPPVDPIFLDPSRWPALVH